MKTIDVVYSSLCEANGAFIGIIKKWFTDTEVNVNSIPFENIPDNLKSYYENLNENCFIDVFYKGERIDSVPLHEEELIKRLDIDMINKKNYEEVVEENQNEEMDSDKFKKLVSLNEISWHVIKKDNYIEEMSMCLKNYPFGNPPLIYHKDCINLKRKTFDEVFEKQDIAGIYAKYKGQVIGLIEVLPREIVRKYGYMTGKKGKDSEYETVGCYEVAYGIPRKEMIDELMNNLLKVSYLFDRRYIEAVGVLGYSEGFNPYWVYDKYGFKKIDELFKNKILLRKNI